MADSGPVFSGLHFYVRDLDKTVGFYQLCGLPIERNSAEGGFLNVRLPDGVGFAFATDAVGRAYDPAFEPPTAGKSHVALQFDLDSRAAVDEMHARLIGAGHPSNLAPIDAYWGSRYCEVSDPDGNVVGFHSPQDRRQPG